MNWIYRHPRYAEFEAKFSDSPDFSLEGFQRWLRNNPRTRRGRKASRQKKAVDWHSLGKEPRGNWEWDYRLNGYVTTARKDFPCECGIKLATPGFHHCKCGKIWNSYAIGRLEDMKTSSAQRYICREIPVREGVIMEASRKQACGDAIDEDNLSEDVKEKRSKDDDAKEKRAKDASFAEAFAAAWAAREAACKRTDITKVGDEDDEDVTESKMRKQPQDWARRTDKGQWYRGDGHKK